ncbi:glucose-repressible protein [Purpureocillium lavendulum]|uniref:Glucose-repressible protein n=1 Tax=Purpureocillium lavendulum TaxID=1247861 RepID=A0AB34FIN6_9HYPO|nr:glucose-repressible protein [Purpureocillium lavendulum]
MARPFRHPFQEFQFDIFDWYPKHQSCLQYFVEHGQHSVPVQALAALINIKLPFQKASSTPRGHGAEQSDGISAAPGNAISSVTLVPYVRRLVATGFDTPTVLHGFFGDDWTAGLGPIHEEERRNYLFAAKSDTWLKVKANYDMEDGQTVPFLRPLQGVTNKEILSAESNWSEWLAMQDWMLGPRAPPGVSDGQGGAEAATGD